MTSSTLPRQRPNTRCAPCVRRWSWRRWAGTVPPWPSVCGPSVAAVNWWSWAALRGTRLLSPEPPSERSGCASPSPMPPRPGPRTWIWPSMCSIAGRGTSVGGRRTPSPSKRSARPSSRPRTSRRAPSGSSSSPTARSAMPDRRVVAVAGATGVVGRATARHLLATGARVIGLSRRDPGLAGVEHVRVDLSDPDDCRRAATSLADTTHLVYAAVHEQDDLVGGWTAQAHVDRNVAMLSCLLDAVLGVTDQLCHVVALQGTKAYGGYFPLPVPARESWPWRDHVGFY